MPQLLSYFFGVPKRIWLKFKKYTLVKKLIAITALIIFIILGFQLLLYFTKKPSYTLSKAEKTNITETVTETGDITGSGYMNVYSPTNGTVKDVFTKNGQEVNEGEELVTVESSATEQEQQAAYANYMTAKNTLDSANSDLYSYQSTMFSAWDTYKNLAESGKYENDDNSPRNDQRTLPEFHIAQKNWLAAEADYKNQQAVISKAQAQVASTWLLYQATQNATVKAPANGKVSNLSVTNGNTVSINTLTSPAKPILTITKKSATEVVIELSESDIVKVKENQKAKVEITSQNKTYNGIVRRVDSIGTLSNGVIRYNAYIEILKPDEYIKTGMTADVTVTTKELRNVLAVPNSSVKPYQGGRAVRIVGKNNKIIYMPVRIGIKGTSKTQILSGITEGQEVVTALSNEQLKRPGLFN